MTQVPITKRGVLAARAVTTAAIAGCHPARTDTAAERRRLIDERYAEFKRSFSWSGLEAAATVIHVTDTQARTVDNFKRRTSNFQHQITAGVNREQCLQSDDSRRAGKLCVGMDCPAPICTKWFETAELHPAAIAELRPIAPSNGIKHAVLTAGRT